MPTKEKSLATNLASDKFVLRLPDGMRDKIQALAKASGRTMNAEIVAALQEWIDNPEGRDEFAAQVDRIEKMIFQNNQLVAEQVRLLQEQARAKQAVEVVAAALEQGDVQRVLSAIGQAETYLSIPKRFLQPTRPEDGEKAFKEFQKSVEATARELQKRKAKTPQT